MGRKPILGAAELQDLLDRIELHWAEWTSGHISAETFCTELSEVLADRFSLEIQATERAQENKAKEASSAGGADFQAADYLDSRADLAASRSLSNNPDALSTPRRPMSREEFMSIATGDLQALERAWVAYQGVRHLTVPVPMDTELLDWLDGPDGSMNDVMREIRQGKGRIPNYRVAIHMAMEKSRVQKKPTRT